MSIKYVDVSVKGRFLKFPCLEMKNLSIIVVGKWLKKALIKDEDWIEIKDNINPDSLIGEIKKNDLKADLFIFSQKLPDIKPKFDYYHEWKNIAAIPISKYEYWWNGLPQVTRKNVRRSERKGVSIKKVDFNDDLINDIIRVNNSSQVRQGRRFTHYGKKFNQVKMDYSSFIERSDYLAAYFQEKLIGFLRLIYIGQIASVMQLLCMPQYYDKRPANALIAKAVDLCADKGIRYLTYGQLVYNRNEWNQMVEFKRRNGFREIYLPVYYIPLSLKGKIAISLGIHRGLKYFIPIPLQKSYYWLRKVLYEKFEKIGNRP